jgi:DNA-binding response OmpR family regulator
MGKILLIGDNSLLLASYTAVLTSLGRPVVVCNTSDCIRSQLRKNQIDLVIVCFTVQDRSRRTIISDAFARWPRPQILQIVAAEESTHSAYGADGYVSAVDPRAVVGRAKTMLADHTPPPHTPELEPVKPQIV